MFLQPVDTLHDATRRGRAHRLEAFGKRCSIKRPGTPLLFLLSSQAHRVFDLFVVLSGEKSTLAVVVSTLVIAAPFTPLRHRIQSFIDKRFYRSKYDARRTLQAFSAKLRDKTDLEALNNDLVGVVRETMQPVHISLWFCPYQEARGGRGEDARSHDSHQQAARDLTKSARRGGSTSTSRTEGRRSR